MQDSLERHLTFLAQDQNNLNLLLSISNLYFIQDDLESAQIYLNKIKAIDPKACLSQQGLLYLYNGELDKALYHFQSALKQIDLPELRYNLGLTYFLKSDFKTAQDIIATLLYNAPTPLVQLLMARILHQQNAFAKAVSLLNQLLRTEPHHAEALGLLALLYLDTNNEPLAKQFSDKALAIDTTNYDAKLVNLMLRLTEQNTTVDEIKSLLTTHPKDSRLWFALGNTYMIEGHFVLAQNALEKALAIHPHFYDYYIALAWCLLFNDQVEEARQLYQKAITIEDNLAEAWAGLALIDSLKNNMEQSMQSIKKANSSNPHCFLTRIAHTIHLTQQHPQKAQQSLVDLVANQELSVSQKLSKIISNFQLIASP